MKQLIATVTSKGQITIPAELRRLLGLGAGDKVLFVVEDNGSVRVETPRYATLDTLIGAAGSLDPALSWNEVVDIIDQDRATKYEILASISPVTQREGADE